MTWRLAWNERALHPPRMIDARTPFVILDDARAADAAPARLFTGLVRAWTARLPQEVPSLAAFVTAARAEGLSVAGFMGYEAGHALEPKLAPLACPAPADAPPLGWFGAFQKLNELTPDEVAALLPDPAGGWAGPTEPEIGFDRYAGMIGKVKDYIAAGDIYQANLTFRSRIRIAGHPLAVYARLRGARAGWGAVVFTGAHWLLSASPELFYECDRDGRLTARPMKGTAAREQDPAADAAAARRLTADPKERAENLMILDLFRNDLARIAVPGSVAVPSAFEIETYPTVHQMTSTVTARLDPAIGGPAEAFLRLFPSGSVTGAPKIRAMEVIAEVEASPRGPYTGSIGAWTDAGEAFNVAIRTLVLRAGADHGLLGLGSGVVADSTADSEWRECLAKGAFMTAGQRPFELFETLAFDPEWGLRDRDRHLDRLRRSAQALGFTFDGRKAHDLLEKTVKTFPTPTVLRLSLSPGGALRIDPRPMPAAPAGPVTVALRPLPVHPSDFRLRHKTSDRAFYDEARQATGQFEVLFTDPDGFLTEGSFTTLFAERPDGRLATPPLARGLLPGTLRARLVEEGRACEADLTVADLASGFLIGNSVRGLLPARLAD